MLNVMNVMNVMNVLVISIEDRSLSNWFNFWENNITFTKEIKIVVIYNVIWIKYSAIKLLVLSP